MQAAELFVEIDKAGGHTDGAAAFFERRLGRVDGAGHGRAERAKPALALAGRGKVEQLFFGALDLGGRRIVEILAERVVDDVLADRDQLSPEKQVIDVAPIILGVDDRDRGAGEPRQILRAADLGQGSVLVEQVFEGHRIGDLAALDQFADRGINAAVNGIAEMLGQQEFADPRIGGVADQQCAKQRLLGLVVIGREANRGGVALAQRCDPRRAGFHGAKASTGPAAR